MARDPASSCGGESSARPGFRRGRVGVPGAGDECEGSRRGSGDCSESSGDPGTPKLPKGKALNGEKGLERLRLPPLRRREELRGAPASRKSQGMSFGSAAPQRPDPTAALLILKRTGGHAKPPGTPTQPLRPQAGGRGCTQGSPRGTHQGVPLGFAIGHDGEGAHDVLGGGGAAGAPQHGDGQPRQAQVHGHAATAGTAARRAAPGAPHPARERGQVGDRGVESSVSATGTRGRRKGDPKWTQRGPRMDPRWIAVRTQCEANGN